MAIECRPVDGRKAFGICTLTGRIDAGAVPAVRQELAAMAGQGRTRLIVLMGGLEAISAAGLNCFVEFVQKSGRRGGVRFAAPPPQVRRMMELMGLNALFEVLETEEDALQGLEMRY